MTKGNVDDRISVPELTDGLTGVMYADKGYIKQNLFVSLYERGLKMVHRIKKNMPNKLMDLKEKIMLRKRNLIETVFDYLKNKMNLEHTRHRSPINAFVHILSTLVAYSLKKNKPSREHSLNCVSIEYHTLEFNLSGKKISSCETVTAQFGIGIFHLAVICFICRSQDLILQTL